MGGNGWKIQHVDKTEGRRDRFEKETVPEAAPFRLKVRFRRDLYMFADNVAHALRTKITYRSDEGGVARGLVLNSDPDRSLHRIHRMGRDEWDWRDGEPVWIWALLYRRKSAVATERWVTMIKFSEFWSDKTFAPDVVRARVTPQERAEQIIDTAINASAKLKGDKGRRIRGYLKLARLRGWPGMLQLWHYNPHAVHELAWSDNPDELFRRSGGKFPLDGDVPGQWQGKAPSWRWYPFRDFLQKSLDGSIEMWRLDQMDKDILQSIYELRAVPGGKASGGEDAVHPLIRAFRNHVIALAKTTGNLYNEAERNTTAPGDASPPKIPFPWLDR